MPPLLSTNCSEISPGGYAIGDVTNEFIYSVFIRVLMDKGAMVHRGINIGDTTCGLCGYGTETTDHLAASCIMVKAIWWHIHVWLKIPFHGSATSGDDILEDLHKHNGSYQWKKVLEVVMFTTWFTCHTC
ncbi:hypothetical protein L1987_36366 [Smallanthus sonchifolius]|uniref:Uncharacterized protein n=1 Tax=Smallanthus sonchifolius TaxID=185202 RepID=A0ACB9HDE2_9ASTR|nr:hypothetical protein L1987_36366 [Smallanthus sonchifolius]